MQAFTEMKVPLRLVSITSSHWSGVIASILACGNDTVEDYDDDKLLLLDDIFAAVGDSVNENELRFGRNAQDGNDHMIANVDPGRKRVTLFYDEDGQGGVGKVRCQARVQGQP